MITEIYVPRSSLVDFMQQARLALREQKANLIYGTVRLIEKNEESFLAWARQDYACIVFNLSHATQRAGHPKGHENFPRLDRSRNPLRRRILPDLSPVGHCPAGRPLLSAVSAIPRSEVVIQPDRTLSKRLVLTP